MTRSILHGLKISLLNVVEIHGGSLDSQIISKSLKNTSVILNSYQTIDGNEFFIGEVVTKGNYLYYFYV